MGHLQKTPPLNFGGENPRGVRIETKVSIVRMFNLNLVSIMNKLKITAISSLQTEKERVDGKVSREYFTAKFVDESNPFAIKEQSRNFFQQHNADGTEATWGALNYDRVKSMVGQTCPGYIANETVVSYDIDGREVNSYTAVVLPGENKASLFKALGHPLADSASEEIVDGDLS